ncbi:hypothetical protein Tsubulata_025159 [Turnera subulata]|uniref:NB-ARC domain-containing protein n=1 Tax=Turnera subulata TaxID=218843 RepID=A0A9Q0JMQ3_9ROSI|nr:hypothetical protein Tsubulata_025159 [Turnera subulata]
MERAPHTGAGRVVTDSILSKSEQIIGRDNDVSEVIELLNVSRDEMLSIVPIVGMGGLGKTTLAKLVIKAVEEKSLFDKKIWVCVSQDFNIQRILGEMLENLEGRSMMSNLDAIERRLQDNLEGKRFLLVLDDVWNKESKKWKSLKDCLSKVSGSNGNVVLVTTRSQETASMMETRPGGRHLLKGLGDEEWIKAFFGSCVRPQSWNSSSCRLLSLRHFYLTSFRGKWPRDFCLPDNLVDVRLIDCDNVDEIPSLGHLPNLRTLHIDGMAKVSCIGVEESSENNGVKLFPALKEFRLQNMENLVEWMLPRNGGEELILFPSLHVLFIDSCSKLRSIPRGTHMPSLVRLIIYNCDELCDLSDEFQVGTPIEEITMCGTLKSMPSLQLTSLPIGLQYCTKLQELVVRDSPIDDFPIEDLTGFLSLERLEIGDIERSTCLPIGLGSCTSLKQLRIWRWEQLNSVPDDLLGKLTSLVELWIIHCPRLTYIPEDIFGGFTRLKHLAIGGFWEELEAFPGLNSIQNLNHTLEKLHIRGWRKLESLPNQLQQLTSLKELVIYEFDGIEILPEWLSNLSSLRSIEIYYCRNLKHLPSASAMQCLSKLQQIEISGCPILRENCNQETGPEWSKIRHIPQIWIT